MTGKNAIGEDRKFWGVLPVMEADAMVGIAQRYEAMGYEGLFAIQVYGPPFLPLALAAAATKRLKIATGIAIAAARSPFETAMAAIDLDRMSGGRFTLGLGTSVAAWSTGVFGAPEYKPVTHLRDTVAAVRHIVDGAHKGLQPYAGAYYSADFKALKPIEAPVRDRIPIWIAALREKLTRTGAEIGDGVIGHPMWSVEWTINQTKSAIEDALQAAGRVRRDIEVNLWPWVAVNNNERDAINDGRATVAFYAAMAQYESFFAAHGYAKEAQACQALMAETGSAVPPLDAVPDEMVKTFVVVGDQDTVREKLEPLWDVADSMCPTPPLWYLPPEKVQFYAAGIGALIAKELG
ncbi:MAG: LLM class flavin-dependent oxidoreductase [Proteobacteria bacterium]|nr:MAG: LLM class flavin-dependent oxidoreductase [Pseudomonadota bacterium]